MSDVKCPKCRGSLRGLHGWDPDGVMLDASGAACADCGAEFQEVADFANLCWQEIRERLPTEEEESAHRERHGVDAGWMVETPGLVDHDGHPVFWCDHRGPLKALRVGFFIGSAVGTCNGTVRSGIM